MVSSGLSPLAAATGRPLKCVASTTEASPLRQTIANSQLRSRRLTPTSSVAENCIYEKRANHAIFPVTFFNACSSLWLFKQLRYIYFVYNMSYNCFLASIIIIVVIITMITTTVKIVFWPWVLYADRRVPARWGSLCKQ